MIKSMESQFKDWRSDKAGIGLTGHYEKLFLPLKDKPITFLEVGTAHGESLQWACEWFHSDAKILGVDIMYPSLKPEKAQFFEINQNDTEKLLTLGKDHGPFDIIIDDASHAFKETVNTFNTLYPYVKKGGMYIIEDWGAGYLPQNDHCKGVETFVVELIWKYGGTVVNDRGNYAVIHKHLGYGGFALIHK